jgi:urease accessory protein
MASRSAIDELADLTVYVIDVAAGDKSRAKAAPGSPDPTSSSSTRSTSRRWSAPTSKSWSATPGACACERSFVFTNLKCGDGADAIVDFIAMRGGLGV